MDTLPIFNSSRKRRNPYSDSESFSKVRGGKYPSVETTTKLHPQATLAFAEIGKSHLRNTNGQSTTYSDSTISPAITEKSVIEGASTNIVSSNIPENTSKTVTKSSTSSNADSGATMSPRSTGARSVVEAALLKSLNQMLAVTCKNLNENTSQQIINNYIQRVMLATQIDDSKGIEDLNKSSNYSGGMLLHPETTNNSLIKSYLLPYQYLKPKVEWNSFNSQFIYTPSNLSINAASINPIIATLNGPEYYQVIGNKLKINQMYIRYQIVPKTVFTDGVLTMGSIPFSVRMVIVWDFQPNGNATPQYADIFVDAVPSIDPATPDAKLVPSFLAFDNLSNAQRFQVLLDETLVMPGLNYSSAPSSAFSNNNTLTSVEGCLKLDLNKINLNNLSTKTRKELLTTFTTNTQIVDQTTIVTGQAYLVFCPIENTAVNDAITGGVVFPLPTVNANVRVYYS